MKGPAAFHEVTPDDDAAFPGDVYILHNPGADMLFLYIRGVSYGDKLTKFATPMSIRRNGTIAYSYAPPLRQYRCRR